MNKKYTSFLSYLTPETKVLIVTHQDPDFDAIGSSLALSLQLTRLNIPNKIWIPDPFSSEYQVLPNIQTITSTFPKDLNHTLTIALDAAKKDRIKNIHYLETHTTPLINIDHHQDNPEYGDLNIVESISSVGELLYNIFEFANWPISYDIACCLYAAISFDTGQFRHDITTKKTHHIVGNLLDLGIPHTKLHDAIFENKPVEYFNVIRIAIDNLVVNNELGYAYTVIPEHIAPILSSTIIDFFRMIKNINIVLVFKAAKSNQVKISIRSKSEFNVASFASNFGGGGHVKAAGIKMEGAIDNVINTIIAKLHFCINRK